MTDDLGQLEALAGSLLRNLSAPQRRGLLRRMARALQQGQSRRIAAQLNPDGTPFQPRKQSAIRQQRGAVRRKAMFTALRRAKFLRSDADDTGFWVGFTGRASRIASVHQYGLRDRPSLRTKPVAYPVRQIVGDTPAERGMLLDMLFDHISAT